MFKKVNKDKSEVKFEDLLEQFGKYQIWQYFLACIPTLYVTMANVNYVFVAGDVNHRCRVSECESAVPEFSPSWWPSTAVGSCYRPVLNDTAYILNSTCSNDSFTGAVEKCTDILYERDETIMSEFNLGCEQWKVRLVGTMHGLGSIIAVVGSGWMCDKFGRKPTLILGGVACILGNLKVFAKSYNLYLVIEFIEGAITYAVYTAGPVIMSENSNSNTRTLAGVLFAYAVYLGEVALALFAVAVPYWKNLLHVLCSPPLLFLTYYLIMDESIRWQIITGRLKGARASLKRMVRWNGLPFKSEEVDQKSDDEIRKLLKVKDDEKREGTREIFKSRIIVMRLVAGTVWRLTVSFIYYFLVVNSVFLPGNKYTNFIMSSLMSFPGELLSMYLMNKLGRRIPLMGGFLVCAATCIASIFVPDSLTWLKIVFFLFGKFLASANYTASVVYTLELFPTSVRGFCTGICTLAACAGCMLAPLTPTLTDISPILTAFCILFCSLVAFGLMFTTPETRGLPLPNTIEQVTEMTRQGGKMTKQNGEAATNGNGIHNSAFSDNSVLSNK